MDEEFLFDYGVINPSADEGLFYDYGVTPISEPSSDLLEANIRAAQNWGSYGTRSVGPGEYPVKFDLASEIARAEQDPFAKVAFSDYLSKGVTGLGGLLSALQGKKDPALPGGQQGTDYLKLMLALFAAKKARDEAKNPRMITSGGGTTEGPAGPKSLGRYVTTGPTGQPIMAYRYAQGGETRPFPMQDGGFVMTGDAVEGAGGPQGIKRLLPEAEMIRGPGTATSDSIPAYIQGKNGRTPALVSNGEAYVPPGRDTRGLYTLMKQLERNA